MSDPARARPAQPRRLEPAGRRPRPGGRGRCRGSCPIERPARPARVRPGAAGPRASALPLAPALAQRGAGGQLVPRPHASRRCPVAVEPRRAPPLARRSRPGPRPSQACCSWARRSRLTRLGVGLVRMRSLRRRGRGRWTRRRGSAALRDEVAPRARFLALRPRPARPPTFGLRRPVVLLPTGFESMERERQAAIAAPRARPRAPRRLAGAGGRGAADRPSSSSTPPSTGSSAASASPASRPWTRRSSAASASREAYLESLVEVARSAACARAVPAAPFLRESHLRERVDLLLKEVSMSARPHAINVG